MMDPCVKQTADQIRVEIGASMEYLSIAAHFSKDSVNRPGFAKFFFDAASEEREHAHKLIEYLAMRGDYMKILAMNSRDENGVESTEKLFDFAKIVKGNTVTAMEGLDALKKALKMEKAVTASIKKLIKECEKDDNDYHFVDYLTGEFLEEQYNGQRDIAGKIATLGKMVASGPSAELAEFLFDKQLL